MDLKRAPASGHDGTPRAWRLIYGGGERRDDAVRGTPADGPTNMAVDTALLASVQAGGAPVLRLYRWSPACLSFGRNQPARDRYDLAAAEARRIDFVRRPTGGRAVFHHIELTYAVAAPAGLLGGPRRTYRRINAALADGLRRLGVEAVVAEPAVAAAGGGGATAAWTAPCFDRPERGEVVVRDRKLVGSAQRTERRTVLQHGSVLVAGSQAPAADLLVDGANAGAGDGWTTLDAELGRRPDWSELADALVAAFGATIADGLDRDVLTAEERARVGTLRRRYASTEWTWRR